MARSTRGSRSRRRWPSRSWCTASRHGPQVRERVARAAARWWACPRARPGATRTSSRAASASASASPARSPPSRAWWWPTSRSRRSTSRCGRRSSTCWRSSRHRLGLALLFVAHDLAVVEQIADRIAVIYLGKVVELAPARQLFQRPLHPYTVSLLSAVPVPDPGRRRQRILLAGDPPSPLHPPPGCHFHPRCPIARPRCATETPPLLPAAPGHSVACFYAGELQPAVAAGPPSPQRGALG